MNSSKGKYFRAYDEEQMVRAISLFRKKKWSKRKAAKLCGVPESTLRAVLKKNKSGKFENPLGRLPLLPHEEECMLKDHIIHLSNLGYSFTRTDVLKLATQTAVFLKVKEDPSHLLSRHWLARFYSRFPEVKAVVSLKPRRKRPKAVTEQTMSTYFNELNDIMVKHKLKDKPHMIFSIDETLIDFKDKPTTVATPQGPKVNEITTDKGVVATILGSGSAIGHVMPPYFILKGKRLTDKIKAGAYPGSGLKITSNGWSNGEVFEDYIENHFSKHLPARDPDQHTLLLYDGHTSYFPKNLINYALSKKIILFVLPPHSCHLFQPLDDGTFKPLKDFYHHECQTHVENNPGQVITSNEEVCQLISKAYLKAFTPLNLISSFQNSGVFLCNNVVSDEQNILGIILNAQTS